MVQVHEKNIIHRDLKPHNILLDKDKHVKLSDFGISYWVDVDTQTETSRGLGTFKFMAPELLNEKAYDNKVDVYAFGVVVFFILSCGKYPEINIVDVGNGKKAKIPNQINNISKDLINMCWSTEPENRPSFKQIIEYIESHKFNLINEGEKNILQIRDFLSLH